MSRTEYIVVTETAMDWDEYTSKIARNWWSVDVPDLAWFGATPTMLSPGEIKMLYWLARQHPGLTPDQVVVDLGPFLGGSTVALGAGLKARGTLELPRLYAYDMFRVPQDGYSQGLIAVARPVGTSVLDLYHEQIVPVSNLVAICPGDFAQARLPAAQRALLFVDLAKTWALNQHVIEECFPRLVPGRALLIQQDYNDHSCPHLHVTMAIYQDHFEYLTDEGASRVFRLTKPFTAADLRDLTVLPYDEQLRWSVCAEATSRGITKFFVSVARAWLFFDAEGPDQALAYLAALQAHGPAQPWVSETPYIDLVADSMRGLGSQAGKVRYYDTFFGTAAP
jgi:hypothetical protein